MNARPREIEWVIPVALICFLQAGLCFVAGAQVPALVSYTLLAYVGFALVAVARYLWFLFQIARANESDPLRRTAELIRSNSPRVMTVVVGVQLLALGGSTFNSMKVALPNVNPFWFDRPAASIENALFGYHPWEISHALLGWATPIIDIIYASWLPIAVIATYSVLAMKPSQLKSQAMISQALIWLVVGIGGAYLFSSAGPIFYDRIFGGDQFARLADALRTEGATVALRTSDMLWERYSGNVVDVGTGISAMPSLHVGIALWLALVVDRSRFRLLARAYYILIWLGSVHLGWHYAADGLVASIGVLLLWRIAPAFALGRRIGRTEVAAVPQPTALSEPAAAEQAS